MSTNMVDGSNNVEKLAVSARDAAKLLDVSVSHLWAMHSSGRIPQPVRFGRAVRWPVTELRAWLAAGAPERGEWETIKSAT